MPLDSSPSAPATLVEAWERAAREFPGRGFGMLDSRGRRGEHRSYAELWAGIQTCAARLATLGLHPGAPVPICLPTSWEFFEVWFGALLAGGLPLALAPPGAMGTSEYQLARFAGVVERLGARHAICRPAVRKEAHGHGLTLLVETAISTDELAATDPRPGFEVPAPDPAEIAFLQLTSGSTGHPRAVMISHRAAVHNPIAIDRAIASAAEITGGRGALEAGVSGVTWLPLHHDMGLVGCLFYCLLAGIDLWFLSARSFLGRPLTWLKTLASLPRAFSPAPNFAYQTCIERIRPDQVADLDLGGWCAAMIGAEMIRPETLREFSATFAGCGFDARALRPCYGLAEATLAVTFDQGGEGLRTRSLPAGAEPGSGPAEIACVGAPIQDTEVRIAAPDASPLGAERIGEVWVRGPGVFAGYYGDPGASAQGLRGEWLRTGDLGFLAGGELWITGRIKDLIIINGQNIMPHEIEWLAESITGGGGSARCCALSIQRGSEGERPVLVHEVGDEACNSLAELERLIRIEVGRSLGVPLMDVCFVRRGRIPKTTSGKVRRSALLDLYLRGELDRILVDVS